MSKPEQENTSDQRRESKIFISYDGILADRMSWNLDALAGLSKAADLREAVLVRKGNALPPRNIVSMGNRLIWKRLADPSEWFLSKNEAPKTVELKINSNSREVLLNDQIIADQVTSQTGKFSEHTYISEFDKLAKRGICQAVLGEKWFQLIFTGLWIDFVLFPANLGKNLIMNAWIDGTNGSPLLAGVEGVVGGGLMTFATLAFLTGVSTPLLSHKHPGELDAISSFSDLNPLKHAQDYIRAKRYISKDLKTVVSLKD